MTAIIVLAALLGSVSAIAAVVLIPGGAWDRWQGRRPRPVPPSSPPAVPLGPGELAVLDRLAARLGAGDNKAGQQLADHLRRKMPDLTDVQIARILLCCLTVTRYFLRHAVTSSEGAGKWMEAASGAALDLTSLEREETPAP